MLSRSYFKPVQAASARSDGLPPSPTPPPPAAPELADLGIGVGVGVGAAGGARISDPDALLLRRYRATGERAAFEALFRKYQAPIYGFVVRLVGPEAAYDLTQEVFLRALRSLGAFRGDSSFRTWLYIIARHVCYNHCRDERRRHAVESLFSESDGGGGGGGGGDADAAGEAGECAAEREAAAPGPSVERIAEMQELQRIVASILDTMTVEQRLMITLRDFEQVSYEEMMAITDLSLANVKSKLHRARASFKQRFEPYWKAMLEPDYAGAGLDEPERFYR